MWSTRATPTPHAPCRLASSGPSLLPTRSAGASSWAASSYDVGELAVLGVAGIGLREPVPQPGPSLFTALVTGEHDVHLRGEQRRQDRRQQGAGGGRADAGARHCSRHRWHNHDRRRAGVVPAAKECGDCVRVAFLLLQLSGEMLAVYDCKLLVRSSEGGVQGPLPGEVGWEVGGFHDNYGVKLQASGGVRVDDSD